MTTLALALLLAAASEAAPASAPAPSREAVPAQQPPPSREAVPKLGGGSLRPGGPSTAVPKRPVLPKGVNAARVEVAGCLAAADEAGSRRFEVDPTSRAPSSPPTVEAVPSGLVVRHPLTHACCLKATVSSRVEGQRILVREELTGTPCRCMCGSTITAAVRTAPGAYRVEIEVVKSEGIERLHDLAVVVR